MPLRDKFERFYTRFEAIAVCNLSACGRCWALRRTWQHRRSSCASPSIDCAHEVAVTCPVETTFNKILLIGSGPIVIGQACEFDYSGTQACKALRDEGYEVVLVNSNPATIMTDPATADRTYIEPLTWQIVEKVIAAERPDALLPTLGGQTGLEPGDGPMAKRRVGKVRRRDDRRAMPT